MEAYVFVRDASLGVVNALKELHDTYPDEIRAVATLTGEFDAIVFIAVDSLEQLSDAVFGRIRGEAGAVGTETAIFLAGPLQPIAGGSNGESVMSPIPMWPKRGILAEYEAIVRARTVAGSAKAAMQEISEMPGVLGVAAVTGNFDVLVELGTYGPDGFDALRDLLLGLNEVPGLMWTNSSIADFVAWPDSAVPEEQSS